MLYRTPPLNDLLVPVFVVIVVVIASVVAAGCTLPVKLLSTPLLLAAVTAPSRFVKALFGVANPLLTSFVSRLYRHNAAHQQTTPKQRCNQKTFSKHASISFLRDGRNSPLTSLTHSAP
jgi:hypothetical protein